LRFRGLGSALARLARRAAQRHRRVRSARVCQAAGVGHVLAAGAVVVDTDSLGVVKWNDHLGCAPCFGLKIAPFAAITPRL
jgi:hypothetical protein